MATFLLEVGTEELPASFVTSALEQWRSQIPQSLNDHLLPPTAVSVFGTPRRLAVLIQGLPQQQPDQEEDVKGPPVQAAFKDGQPTKAAEGFARKQNVDLAALEVRATDKGEFVFVRQKIAGRSTAELLPELVPSWILSLEGKRFMRWGNGDLRFSRPVRWLVALLDDQILPLELVSGSETIKSDRQSQGHRVLHPEPVVIPQAAEYCQVLEQAFVVVSPEARQTLIESQIQAQAQQVQGTAQVPPDLLAEVVNLVEWPSAVIGKFDTDFLELPPEVITTVMVTHQRYFPVLAAAGATALLPYFIAISNGDPEKAEIIARGNERVIRARLSDAKFFYRADLSQPLAQYLPKLEAVTFQEALGSMHKKVERIGAIANFIIHQLQIPEPESLWIQRAALLCKADLVTQMVGEFPELQGVMGQNYALASGEPEPVATAIAEHYLPKGAYDELPHALTAQVVALADRLDTLVCIFGLGLLPTGSSDPFALRRAANAMINIIWDQNLALNLDQLLQAIATSFSQDYPKSQPLETLQAQLSDFFGQRLRTLLQEERGIDYDLVNAVLGEADPEYRDRALQDLLDVRDRALFLQEIRRDGTLEQIYETVNRATRLARQGELDTQTLDPKTVIQQKVLKQPSEKAFYKALVALLPQTQAAREQRDYRQLVTALAEIAPTVSRFFDGPESVLVMDENPKIRSNRINLLGLLRNHARVLADFGPIVK